MYCCEFLHHPPLNRKGYYFYGDRGNAEYALYDQFPVSYRINTHEELASSAPGAVIVEPEWAIAALDYVGLPTSDRIYLFIPGEDGKNIFHDEIMKAFTKAKLPRIDCSNPTTPKTHQLTVEYIQHRTKLSEQLARKLAVSLRWDLRTILNSLTLWASIVLDTVLPESKAKSLIDILTPPEVLEDFLTNVFNGTFHRISEVDYEALDPVPTLRELSERLNKLRILMEVYTKQKNVSMLLKESGLTTSELKDYIPLLGKWNKTRVKYWTDVLIWTEARIDNPGVIPAMVTLLASK